MRRKKPLPLLEKISITGIAAGGKAVVRHDDRVVFVPFAAPGDVVDVQVTKKRRNFLEGSIVRFHEMSDHRIEPVCEHFGICGGCKWQHLSYEQQLEAKQQEVTDHFRRIGKFDFPASEPILAAPATEFYRNKLEFTFTSRRWLTGEELSSGETFDDMRAAGFHIPGRFDKVLDIKKCWLQPDPSNPIRQAIRDYAIERNLEFFDLVRQEGFLRTLVVRTSSNGEVMVIVVFFRDDREEIQRLLEFTAGSFPEITSLMYVINPKANDTISDLDVKLFSGRDHITEEMEGLKFRVGPKSFYQTNPAQALELYRIVRDYALPRKRETVYDLYTGTGTIALFLAGQCGVVRGLEYVEDAVEDARLNAAVNNIDNATFHAGDIKELLTREFTDRHGKPDTIITDPPRTGMHGDVVGRLAEILPQKIVYVSCNSATQARDIALLDHAYRVERLRAIDMFPHTHHVESMALLTRR
ncbi:MAG: 23S rRNA (uracil(1939)-C(5))-methyltransferase RlmD [Marinilabiliales bacterium]|nr:MAG: 23S rRNA (uracil(1939)-C(5))-methyltransferase RlmD [Marinilabiliales bacterium]